MKKRQQEPAPRVKAAPKTRQVFLCEYPAVEHTFKPEFYKIRPVVILSKNSTKFGVVTVLPITSSRQKDDKFSVPLASPIDGRDSWVVCNHVHTVSVRRLIPPRGSISRISDETFQEILAKVCKNLPMPRNEID